MTMPRLRSTCTALMCSDFCALLVALTVGFMIRLMSDGLLSLSLYLTLVPSLFLFLPLYLSLALYPGIMLPPSEELKRLAIGTSLGYLFLSLILFLAQQGPAFSRFIMLFSWSFSLCTVPLFRYMTRRLCARKPWWGYPVLLFAPRHRIAEVEKEFRARREMGLFVAESIPLDPEGTLPADMEDLCPGRDGKDWCEQRLQAFKARYPDALAFVFGDELSQEMRQQFIVLVGRYFRRVLVHLDSPWINQITLHIADIPGGQVLTLRQNLLDPARMRVKRFLDIILCILGSAFLAVIIPFIALCIKVDSKGPVFFTQNRIGQGGRPIRVFKFRTMVADAQAVLEKVLRENPDLRAEWVRDQKLSRDPRLTRVGEFLRKTSLDELPQVFNVIKGEMSLVGPRPIVENEIARYGDAFALYSRVKPGITGLWQVSGRNDVSYARRVTLDQHYVYNWSVWLDIYIIIRTIPALLTQRGAY